MEQASDHVLTRAGDGLAEVDAALASLASRGVDRESSGFRKAFFVTRADQTVVTVRSREAPLAAELRSRAGWREPGDQPLR
jgi:hypothetical protein